MTQFPPTWASVDTAALGIGNAVLRGSYQAASELTFTVAAPQHSLPFQAYATFVRAWDSEGELDGEPQSGDNPLFEGWVEAIEIGANTSEVRVVCYDPTYRATRRVVCMSSPWEVNPEDAELFPVAADDAYPRIVYNATIDNDDDWALAIELNASLGRIIKSVLDYQALPLYHCNAAPGDGTGAGVETPYEDDDLGSEESSSSGTAWAGRLSFIPQEKVVSQSESVRSLIERLLGTWTPEFKVLWEPGSRLWRIDKLTSATPVTVTWNDPSAEFPVLSMDVRRTAENCFGAMTFYGPEGIEWRSYVWTNPLDSECSSGDVAPPNTLESVNATNISDPVGNDISGHRQFQVTDPDFTRIVGRGATPIWVPDIIVMQVSDGTREVIAEVSSQFVQTFGPQVLVRYKPGAGGNGQWQTKRGWKGDFRTGLIDFGDQAHLCRIRPGLQPYLQEPYQVMLVAPVLTTPIKVRYPSVGMVGTAADAGLGVEKHEYDEALAVGFVYKSPVTTPLRLSRFRTLAQQIVNQRKDLIYSGAIHFEGLDYSWARLGKRVNIAAKSDNGTPLTTGWESINAWVTDVEYDFSEQTTTISISADQAEVIGLDMEQLKARLKIRPAQQRFVFSWSQILATRWGKSLTSWVLGQDVTLQADAWLEWIDEYGEQQ